MNQNFINIHISPFILIIVQFGKSCQFDWAKSIFKCSLFSDFSTKSMRFCRPQNDPIYIGGQWQHVSCLRLAHTA